MNRNINSSLLVVLISASQLILMLVIVGMVCQYAQSSLSDHVQTKLLDENEELFASYESQLAVEVPDPFSSEGSSLVSVDREFLEMELVGGRFYVLLDSETSQPLAASRPSFLIDNSFSNNSILLNAGNQIRLSKLVNGNSREQSTIQSGEFTHDETEYLFSGRKLSQGYLLICQEKAEAFAHIESVIGSLKKAAFTSFLLVGLVGFCISVVVLRRYDEHLTDVKESLEKKVAARTNDLLTTQKAVIHGLAKLAESRDNDTGDHLARIQLYVTILARSLMKHHSEIDDEYIKNLSLASSLHDIGKVGVPDAILLKQGRLTPAERTIMELHTIIGGDCLSSIQSQLGENDFLEMARQIAYYHHERWDGGGYPRGRSDEDIPLCARIVSVADVYDALRTKRPYKQPIPHQESREIILGGLGTQFDPEVVNAFLENEDEFERISAECSKMTAEEVTPKIRILSEMLIQN